MINLRYTYNIRNLILVLISYIICCIFNKIMREKTIMPPAKQMFD